MVDGRHMAAGAEERLLVRSQSTTLADMHLSGCGHFSMDSCAGVLLPEPQPSTSGSEGTTVHTAALLFRICVLAFYFRHRDG